jgi:hypothetical protein
VLVRFNSPMWRTAWKGGRMADEQKVKIYKPDDADSNETVGTKRSTPMIGAILGLVLVIVLGIVLLVNILR